MEQLVLIKNAKIWTADNSNPWASEILIKDDKIVEVSDKVEVDEADIEVVEVQGKLIIPSFIDSHMHPIMAAKLCGAFCLSRENMSPLKRLWKLQENTAKNIRRKRSLICIFTPAHLSLWTQKMLIGICLTNILMIDQR